MEITSNFDMICDVLKQKSVIELLYEKNKEKELKYLINYLVMSEDTKNSSKIISGDLLLLMEN